MIHYIYNVNVNVNVNDSKRPSSVATHREIKLPAWRYSFARQVVKHTHRTAKNTLLNNNNARLVSQRHHRLMIDDRDDNDRGAAEIVRRAFQMGEASATY